MITNLIINRKIGFVELQKMDAKQIMINEMLYRLDMVRHRLELKWGINRLYDLASSDLRKKWTSQMCKLNESIIENDPLVVEEVIKGCVRGWEALEAAALKNGGVPYEAQFWSIVVDGTEYRVVRHPEDEHVVPGSVSIEGLVRVYHAARHNAYTRPPEALNWAVKVEFKQDESLGF